MLSGEWPNQAPSEVAALERILPSARVGASRQQKAAIGALMVTEITEMAAKDHATYSKWEREPPSRTHGAAINLAKNG